MAHIIAEQISHSVRLMYSYWLLRMQHIQYLHFMQIQNMIKLQLQKPTETRLPSEELRYRSLVPFSPGSVVKSL